MDLLVFLFRDIEPGRLLESLIFLFVMLWRMRPYFRKFDGHVQELKAEISGLKAAVQAGFKSGEERFSRIENRVTLLEQIKSNTQE